MLFTHPKDLVRVCNTLLSYASYVALSEVFRGISDVPQLSCYPFVVIPCVCLQRECLYLLVQWVLDERVSGHVALRCSPLHLHCTLLATLHIQGTADISIDLSRNKKLFFCTR